MSSIEQALQKLEMAIIKAEGSIGYVEVSLAGQQRDMFGEPVGDSKPAANGNAGAYIDGGAVADKLNKTIEKMESLLQEA